jgi:hypothetical protein
VEALTHMFSKWQNSRDEKKKKRAGKMIERGRN